MTYGTSSASFFRPAVTMKTVDVGNHPNDKNSSEQYFAREQKEEETNEFKQSEFVDKSAQLTASLNSLAMLNASKVIKVRSKKK